MSGSPPPAENPCGQKQDRPDQRKNSLDANSDQAKRQREEPDEWKKHQDEKRERPRHNQEQAPNEKGNERFHEVGFHRAVKRQPLCSSTPARARWCSRWKRACRFDRKMDFS